MATCFLFTEHLSENSCLSLKLDRQGHIEAPLSQRSFAEIKTLQSNCETYLVAPGQQFSFYQLELPWLAEKKARAAIPFALEDKLAQNVDLLHFAFDKQYYQNGYYLVVVADKRYLQELINRFDSHGINFEKLSVDWFALNANELVLSQNSLLVNEETFQGVLSLELIPFYLEKSAEQTVYCFSDSDKTKLNPTTRLSEIPESVYLWLAQRLQKTDAMNLCQGELQHGSGPTKTKRLYQAAIGMCLIWLLSVLAINSMKLYFLSKDTAAVDAKIAVIYQDFFPGSKQVISPKFRISQMLKSNQGASDSALWILLNKLAKTLKTDEVTIEQLRFQNQTLTLTLATKNFGTLENFQTKLQQDKVKLRQTQASTRGDQVVGTLELTL